VNANKFPQNALNVRYQTMTIIEVRHLLSKLLSMETRSHPASKYKELHQYHIRFRWKRLRVVNHYVSLGGEVSSIILKRKLPSWKKWPGIVHLIKTKGFELIDDY